MDFGLSLKQVYRLFFREGVKMGGSFMSFVKAAFLMVLFSAMGLYVFAILISFYWWLSPLPVEVVSQKLLTPNIRAGGKLQIEYTVKRNALCPATIQKFLYEGETKDKGSSPRRRIVEQIYLLAGGGVLGLDNYIRETKIPDDAIPGPARITVLSSYMCNPIRSFWPLTSPAEDIFFNILPATANESKRDKLPVENF